MTEQRQDARVSQALLESLLAIREAAWKVIVANQPVLLGTPEDALYFLLCMSPMTEAGLPSTDAIRSELQANSKGSPNLGVGQSQAAAMRNEELA